MTTGKEISGLTMNTKENLLLPFGICLKNEGYLASLEIGKLYPVLPDKEAAAHGYLQVIDESGEAYAYAANCFHLIQLPVAVGEALLAASST